MKETYKVKVPKHIKVGDVVDESSVKDTDQAEQLDLFTDYEELQKKRAKEKASLEREKRMQKAIIAINTIL